MGALSWREEAQNAGAAPRRNSDDACDFDRPGWLAHGNNPRQTSVAGAQRGRRINPDVPRRLLIRSVTCGSPELVRSTLPKDRQLTNGRVVITNEKTMAFWI